MKVVGYDNILYTSPYNGKIYNEVIDTEFIKSFKKRDGTDEYFIDIINNSGRLICWIFNWSSQRNIVYEKLKKILDVIQLEQDEIDKNNKNLHLEIKKFEELAKCKTHIIIKCENWTKEFIKYLSKNYPVIRYCKCSPYIKVTLNKSKNQ